MKIQIVKQEKNSIEFLVERENGMYNNCNLTTTYADEEVKELTQSQIYQLAWDKIKHIAYRVFNQIEPLAEEENFIGFEVEELPPPPPLLPQPPSLEERLLMAEETILFLMDMNLMGGM